jgi:8-oxo-dGTP pyrophosphatase MutT (NUDIX family)
VQVEFHPRLAKVDRMVMKNKSPEELIYVDNRGIVKRFSANGGQSTDAFLAVVLVLPYLQQQQRIVLFSRAAGAHDMQHHWALTAGKVNTADLAETRSAALGHKLSIATARNCAMRELMEELNIAVTAHRFDTVFDFVIPTKGIYYTLMAWPMTDREFDELSPDGVEVDEIRCFSLVELDSSNDRFGDAIRYGKQEILGFLHERFATEEFR